MMKNSHMGLNVKINRIIIFLLSIVVALVMLKFTYSNLTVLKMVCSSEYPLESREWVSIIITDILHAGKGLYDNSIQPYGTYVYGPVFPYLTALLSNFAENTLSAHRLISVLSILGCCILLYAMLSLSPVPRIIKLFASFSLLFYLTVSTNTIARPDALGLFLLILSIYVPYRLNYSKLGLLFSGVFCFLALLTKQYFAVGAPSVYLYVALFINFRRGMVGATLFFICLGTMLAGSYFYNNAFFTNYIFGIINDSTSSWEHMIRHLKDVITYHFGYIAIIIVALFYNENKSEKEDKLSSNTSGIIKYQVPLSLFLLVLFFWVIVIKLGPHIGNDYLYYFHLFTPFLIWASFDCLPVCLYQNQKALLASLLLVCCFTFHYYLVPMRYKYYNDYQDGWNKVEEYARTHKNVLFQRYSAGYAVKYDHQYVDTGHSQYASIASLDNNQSAGADDYRNNFKEFNNEIYNKMVNQEFDLIITDEKSRVELVPKKLINDYYEQVDIARIGFTFNGARNVNILKPKDK